MAEQIKNKTRTVVLFLKCITSALTIYTCIFILASTKLEVNKSINFANKGSTLDRLVEDTLGDDSKHEPDYDCDSKRMICGRCIPNKERTNFTIRAMNETTQEKVIMIGFKGYGQTNNRLIELYKAIHAANVAKSSLYIVAGSWAHSVLSLFLDKGGIQHFEQTFGARIIKRKYFGLGPFDIGTAQVEKFNGEDLFYYKFRSKNSSDEIEAIARELLFFLLSNAKSRTCSSVNYFGLQSHTEPYTVIHSRWMKRTDMDCLTRLRRHARNVFTQQNIRLDRTAPCELPPSYIRSILVQNDLMYTTDANVTANVTHSRQLSSSPIYVITDGFNRAIIQTLKEDPLIGHRIYEVPDNDVVRWVIGDMMLGALSSVFIGTLTSTMSMNIARTRIALGFDGTTNYIMPLEREQNDTDIW
eukprot:CAMPEP_0194229258 /NCGR_PEP_ID=MMETSP0156-20130528/43801_1 /TAXON_ID=33649 /ORGANISM="Thalassionema nitzschioides, Strain L26-B" /LENGTH=413 /DNA_ID=CAMNT_0038961803 /DNA_START=1291 /DNA_END=2529 /DNA_ORIENTATION=+